MLNVLREVSSDILLFFFLLSFFLNIWCSDNGHCLWSIDLYQLWQGQGNSTVKLGSSSTLRNRYLKQKSQFEQTLYVADTSL